MNTISPSKAGELERLHERYLQEDEELRQRADFQELSDPMQAAVRTRLRQRFEAYADLVREAPG